METKQIIQNSANVIRVTNIKVGDVYKRFDTTYDDRVCFGIVTAVHNDGVKAVVQATEYRYSYSNIDVAYKVIQGEKDYTLFPATPDELSLELEKCRDAKRREIEKAQATIELNTAIIKDIDGLISGETQKRLTAMSYKEMTQAEYDRKVSELVSA